MDTESLDKINDGFIKQAANFGALLELLIDKGIINEKEWSKGIIKWTAILDQESKRKMEEQEAKFKEENPDTYKAMEFLNKIMKNQGGL